jgi:RuvA, C-terminal domain
MLGSPLVTAGVDRLTAKVEGGRQAPSRAPAVPPGRRLRLVTPPLRPTGQAEQLTGALVQLGFRPAEVRPVVAGLGARVEHEPLASLIKDALAALTRAA